MHFTMPVPPLPDHQYHSYYQSFVRSMSKVDTTRQAERIRASIEMTADNMETSPAFIARLLVAFGLQAPKDAFPKEFINYVNSRDKSINYFNFERSDYLDDLSLLWEYEEVNRSSMQKRSQPNNDNIVKLT